MKYLYFFSVLLCSVFGTAQTIGIQSFATGFSQPAEIANAGDERLFVVQQGGLIRILNANGTVNATPFLNVSSLVTTDGNEQGLLGLAFHPQYATNGYFFINYTNLSGNTVIARYSVNTGNPQTANPASALILKTIAQPFSNHNGGSLHFGSDGYLYIGMGDGGGSGDTGNRAQNKSELLGKMLRLDVDAASPYIPADNPYVGIDGADEIWAIGLRNPWKFSFDDGYLWIADVGQENVEEINKMPAETPGLNYGWRCYEGNASFNTAGCAPQGTMTFPFTTYSSASGSGNCSITGGYVYRGTTYPNFQGKYFFADYCSNKIGMVNSLGAITYSSAFSNTNFTTFGVDINNNLYVAASSSGIIYKVVDTSLGVDETAHAGFSMFPNPAGSTVSVMATNVVFPLQVSISDISGKKIIESRMKQQMDLIHTDQLQGGLYIVTMQDAVGATCSSKLVIK